MTVSPRDGSLTVFVVTALAVLLFELAADTALAGNRGFQLVAAACDITVIAFGTHRAAHHLTALPLGHRP